MKRIITVFIALTLSVAIAGPAFGAKKKTKPSSSTSSKHGRLVGTVVSASGRHAGHARVTIRKVGGRKRLHPRVNAAGHFSAKLKGGAYRVSASHRSMGSGHATASAAAGGTSSVTVRLSGHAGHRHLRHHRHLHAHVHKKKSGLTGSHKSTKVTGSSGGSGAARSSTNAK